MSRVARPSSNTRTPVARGSSVPRCPICRKPANWRTASTTSCDVFPFGLLMTSAPSNGAGCGWRGILTSRCGGLVLFHFLQELFDAFNVFLGEVQSKVQLRHAAKLQPLDKFPPDVSRSMFERLDGVGLLLVGSLHVDENARVLHVRLDAYFAGDHAAFQPRIFQFTREHGVDFVSDLLAHAFVSVIGRTHFLFLPFVHGRR